MKILKILEIKPTSSMALFSALISYPLWIAFWNLENVEIRNLASMKVLERSPGQFRTRLTLLTSQILDLAQIIKILIFIIIFVEQKSFR